MIYESMFIVILLLIIVFLLLKLKVYIQKNKEYINFNVMLCWVERLIDDGTLKQIFQERGINRFGIYGMGKTGILLMKEIKKNNLKADFIIEKNPLGMPDYGIPIISIKELSYQKDTDSIIICATHGQDEMRLNINANGFDGNIYLLEDLIANWR